MYHDPMFAIALTDIKTASEAVDHAREALATAEANRDQLIRDTLAATDMRGAKAHISRAAGLTHQRIAQIGRGAR